MTTVQGSVTNAHTQVGRSAAKAKVKSKDKGVGLCIVNGQGHYSQWSRSLFFAVFPQSNTRKIYSGQFLKRGTKGKGQLFENT